MHNYHLCERRAVVSRSLERVLTRIRLAARNPPTPAARVDWRLEFDHFAVALLAARIYSPQ